MYLPSSPEKALCLAQSRNAEPVSLCIYDTFDGLHPSAKKMGWIHPFSVHCPDVLCQLLFLLLVESQAYGEIDMSSNCTWLGLSYLAKVLSDQKNQHSSVVCSPFLPSLLKIGDLLFLSPPLFCYIILSNMLCVCYLPPIHADTHPDPLQTYKSQVKFTFLQSFYSPLMLFLSVAFFLQTLLFKCFCRLFGTNSPLPKRFPDLNWKQKYEVDQQNYFKIALESA